MFDHVRTAYLFFYYVRPLHGREVCVDLVMIKDTNGQNDTLFNPTLCLSTYYIAHVWKYPLPMVLSFQAQSRKGHPVLLTVNCSNIDNVMESRCKYLSFWNLLEFDVTQCLYQNFLLLRYETF